MVQEGLKTAQDKAGGGKNKSSHFIQNYQLGYHQHLLGAVHLLEEGVIGVEGVDDQLVSVTQDSAL